MKIEARKPKTPFDFGAAVTQPFRTEGGKAYVIRMVIWMAALLTLVMLITLPFFLPFYGEILEYNWRNMQSIMAGGTPPDPSDMLQVFAKAGPAYLAMTFGMWAIMVSGETALHRKVLRGEDGRCPIGFGISELRVILAQLGVWGLWFVFYILGVVILMALSALLNEILPVLGILIAFVGVIALLMGLIWLPIRLAPAAALSTLDGKTHVLAAGKVSKNRFWPLFGAYAVVGIFGYVGIYSVLGIGAVIISGNGDIITALSGFGTESPLIAWEAAADRLKNPFYMIIAVIILMINTALVCVWGLCYAGIGTYAVKWWQSDDPTPNFD